MTQQPDGWKVESRREVADCRVFKVREDATVRDSDGARSTFFVVENPDWVNVVAITAEGDVVLIEQFRHGVERMILEIPGGMVDEGEDPKVGAARELIEETGFAPGRLIPIGTSFPNPAIQNNTIHHFLALDCTKTRDVEFDDHESIATRLVPLSELNKLVHNGDITHSLAITAIFYAQRFLKDEGLIN